MVEHSLMGCAWGVPVQAPTLTTTEYGSLAAMAGKLYAFFDVVSTSTTKAAIAAIPLSSSQTLYPTHTTLFGASSSDCRSASQVSTS